MRILHLVSSPTLTGPADPALGLARAQRRHLGQDSAIAFDTVRSGNMRAKAEEAAVPVIEGLSLCTKRGLLAAWADRRRLALLAQDFDVIHAHSAHDHALAALARGRARLVRSVHHPRGAARRRFQAVAYRRTDAFAVVAEAHRALLLASYPFLAPQRVLVIPGAVDTDRFQPGADGAAFRRELELPAEGVVLGMVARIKPGRRHVRALGALALARAEGLPVSLVFVGKGEGLDDLRREVAARGLDLAVRFAGFRDQDLPQAYAACDATLLLSEGNDAGCRAVLESLAAGVPVIGGAHPAVQDALHGSGAGVLVDPDDEAQIARAIQQLLRATPGDRAAGRRAARARALAAFTERARAERAAALYRAAEGA